MLAFLCVHLRQHCQFLNLSVLSCVPYSSKGCMKQAVGECMHRTNIATSVLIYKSGVLDAFYFNYSINIARNYAI